MKQFVFTYGFLHLSIFLETMEKAKLATYEVFGSYPRDRAEKINPVILYAVLERLKLRT